MLRKILTTGLTTTMVLAVTLPALGVAKSWNSASDSTWNVANNWTPPGVPLSGDDVTLGNIIGTEGTRTTMDITDSIATLTMQSGNDLDTATFELIVNGLATLSGAGTTLLAKENNGGVGDSIDADTLTVNSGALLQMIGGRVEVDGGTGTGLLSINGTLTGYGAIDLEDIVAANSSRFTLTNGTLNVGNTADGLILFFDTARTLTVNATDVDTTADLDQGGVGATINLLPSGTFDLNIPIVPASDGVYNGTMNLSRKSTLDIEDAWNFSGVMNVNTQAGIFAGQSAGPTTIDGGTMTQSGGTITLNNTADHLIFDTVYSGTGGTISLGPGAITFNSTATIGAGVDFDMTGSNNEINVNATVTVNDTDWDWDASGSSTNVINIGDFGTLNANITAISDRYSATMNIDGGTLNVQGLNNEWGQDGGTITIGGTTQSTIAGDRFLKTGGTLIVDAGANLDINTTAFPVADSGQRFSGGTVTVNGTLDLNGDFTEWAGSTVNGTGRIDPGTHTVTANQTISVATYNWDDGASTIDPGVTFTLDVTGIESSGNQHNNDINVNSGTIDVTVAAGEWQLGTSGDLMLTNTGAGNPAVNGDTLRVLNNGDIFVDGGATFGAELIIDEGGDMTIQGSGGTVSLNSAWTLNGGEIVDTIDRSLANSQVTNNGGLTVTGDSLINVEFFDWDQSSTTIEPTGDLNIVVDSIDGNGLAQEFNNTITMNSGDLSVSSNQVTWIMDGTLNMNNTAGDIPKIQFGEGIDIGDDVGASSGNLNVGGAGISRISTLIDFNADADVFIGAGATLELTSIVDFDTQNGANNAEFTGTGTLRFGQSTANINEPLTINMVGGTVDLDGDDVDTFATINIDAATVINAAAIENYGDGFENLDVDNLNAGNFGTLTVNLDNANDAWTITPDGTLTLRNGNATGNLLGGSTVNLNGTVNVTGDVRTTARVIIGGTVNILTANEPFRIGSSSVNNRIEGGTINGPGLFGADSGRNVDGFGTINADIDFDGSARLRADDGILNVDGAILDVGTIGTIDDDGILDVLNPWNTNVATLVDLNGGELRGNVITNDGASGINGDGLVTARVNNNTRIDAENGGTLRLTNTLNDWDGSTETGQLNALAGNLEIVDNSVFGYTATASIGNGRELFVNGFDLFFDTVSTIALTGGTLRSNNSQTIQGAVTVNTNPSRLQTDSRIFSTATVTLNDDLNLDGDTFVEAGATFSGGASLVNLSGSTLTLEDAANVAVLLENEGTLVLGASPGQTTGLDFEQSATGIWDLEIMDTGLNDYDRMTLTGTAQLDGELDVTLIGGFNPALNDLFTILVAPGSVLGTFAVEDFSAAPLDPGLAWDVLYNATNVQLQVVNAVVADADFDDDGDVDGKDFLAWQAGFNGPGTTNADGNADGDGDVDGDDLGIWEDQYGDGVGPLGDLTSVPEPSSILLAGMFAAGLLIRRQG